MHRVYNDSFHWLFILSQSILTRKCDMRLLLYFIISLFIYFIYLKEMFAVVGGVVGIVSQDDGDV